MLELEGLAAGLEKSRLVIHLPGFDHQAVKKSPLLELDYAGTRFRKALDTLVTEAASGNVPPEEIAAFREQDGFTLARADAWLAAHLSAGAKASPAICGTCHWRH